MIWHINTGVREKEDAEIGRRSKLLAHLANFSRHNKFGMYVLSRNRALGLDGAQIRETTAEHLIMPTPTGLHLLARDDRPLDPGIVTLVELIAR